MKSSLDISTKAPVTPKLPVSHGRKTRLGTIWNLLKKELGASWRLPGLGGGTRAVARSLAHVSQRCSYKGKPYSRDVGPSGNGEEALSDVP